MYDMNNQQYPHMQPTGGYYYQGYQGQPAPVQKINNILSAEQIDKLTSQGEFDLGISEEDLNRALCNHRSKDGERDTLTFDPVTGVARCTICGYTFRPIDSNETADEIKSSVAKIIDILQTIKILYVDLPPQAHRDFFPILAMLEKIPQLFEYASKNFSKHETFNWQYRGYNMNGVQMLANLNNIFNGGGMYQQPQMMGGPAPYQYQQPGFAPQQPQGNPFGYPGAQPQQPMMGNPWMQQNISAPTMNGSAWTPMSSQAPGYQPQAYQGFNPNPAQATTPAPTTVDTKSETAEVKKDIMV
jgi:hypothetical protein